MSVILKIDIILCMLALLKINNNYQHQININNTSTLFCNKVEKIFFIIFEN